MAGPGWPWLGLDRPRRSVLGKLEQEAPVTGAPSEEGHARTSVRVEEVVLPFRDCREPLGPFARHPETRIVRLLRQIAERVPGGAIWPEARVGLEVVGSDVRRLRKLELLPIPAGDDEDT
jgi:hypothetical protein